MALRRISVPWTQQPQEAVRVNLGCPRARGLVAYVLGSGYEVLAQAQPTYIGAIALDATPRGHLWGGFATGFMRVVRWDDVPRVAPPFTVAFDALCASPASRRALVSQGGSGAGNGWYVGINASRQIDLTFGNVANYSASTRALSTGDMVRVAVVVTENGGSGIYYLDGALDSSRSVGTMNTPAAQSLAVGAAYNTSGPISPTSDGATHIGNVALWDRALTADEVAADASNPWDVLAPRQIWVPVAAGGATYTLSAPTYAPGSITSTGMTARVTVTAA